MHHSFKKASFTPWLPAFFSLLIIGGGGLALVMTQSFPTLGPRWLFFFFIMLLFTGIFLPLAWFINVRFPSDPPAQNIVIIRQAILGGVFISLLAWLQMGRVLTLLLGGIIFIVLIVVEYFLRLWERSRWRPNEEAN
jgi:hypothetical protein